MFTYGICVLPLIKRLKAEFTDVTQHWYADDASALGTLTTVELYFNLIKRFSLGSGSYPEPYKSVLIINPSNIYFGKRFVLRHRFKVCTGTRSFGGFLGMMSPNVIR